MGAAVVAPLAGKWVWVWQWPRADGGDVEAVASRLLAAGCRGALVKAYDGPGWFRQGRPWRDICLALRQRGLAVGGWGYHYGEDVEGEARRAIETVAYGEADLLVLDVEGEFKGRPAAAEGLLRLLRRELGDSYPIYFSSYALPRFHRSFPFAPFVAACQGAVPQLYWNAFRLPLAWSLASMYDDYRALGLGPERLLPAAGLYREGTVPYPSPAEVVEFVRMAYARGSPGVSFWSYQHMDAAMWEAVASAPQPEVSEVDSIAERVAALAEWVSRLEERVAVLEGGKAPAPAPAPPPRTYTVQPGDTLWGIGQRLGVDWRRLYEANRETIGPDPDLIRPGQVLVVP